MQRSGSSTEDIFDLPLVHEKDNRLQVQLPKHFRDQSWANGMGLVQEEIGKWAVRGSTIPRKVVFDFTSCRWIDPLPLMSVLLEIVNALHLGITIAVHLPEPDSGPMPSEVGPYQESPNRLLLFLAQEGFLDSLDGLSNGDIYYSNKPADGWKPFRNLRVKPSYEAAECIPMHLFVVPGEEEDDEFAKRSVEHLLVGVGSKLDSKIAPQAQERLIYKLRVALQEIMHNAQEHAYETEVHPRLVSIYVRYRTGGMGLGSASRRVFQECVREERKNCPKLDMDWLSTRPGCIEMFALDRGMGMVNSFEKAGIRLNWKYKFNEVMKKTFSEGYSTKPERQTRYGGLHLLHNLLAETGDYLRALEDGTWFGCGVPIQRSTEGTHQLTKEQRRVRGLAMHFRMGWKEETDYGEKWAKFAHGEQSEVWPELSLSEDICVPSFEWFEAQTIIDERFGELNTYGSQGDWILWLVRPHHMKWDILFFIERTIAPRATGYSVLIIADIPSYEAETYAAALDEYKAPHVNKWPANFSRIILATDRWRFAAVDYQKHEYRHGFSGLHEDFSALRGIPLSINPRPGSIRLGIVRWLKWHDSRRLWDEVGRHGQMFIPEQICWGNDERGEAKNIAGYLDFHHTTHNRLCASIYRMALTRVLGILPPDTVELHPLDRLTRSILREVHATEVYKASANLAETRLALGSVLVSGSTLEASSSFPLDLHFLIHFSSPLRGRKPSLLFWLPKDQVSETAPRLSRIGKTAAIAPEGWKSFEVPRFDAQGKCVGACNPESTYQDWQSSSPVIVKAGHWSYEGHHDFLTINIASAVEAAFLGKNELARFLASRIMPFIGLSKAHVDENWHRLLKTEQCSQAFTSTNHGLLVYRSHPSSDSVIRRLLDLLTPDGRELALSRIFPILPIRMRWSGSTFLIPPLVRENIRKALNCGDQVRPVLLFDDAAITGRTLRDLQASLSAIGALKIKTLVIANRLRQPADGRGEEWLDYYWRLDVPVMGREANCPLCHALHLAEAFSSSLAATNARDEIRTWRQRWGEISPLNNWSAGIHPSPLGTPERETRYCYRQDLQTINNEDKHLARIDLIRSTGLVVHVTELHAMTGRDDYCLKKIKEHSEPEIKVELAASQLLLFGSEFDLDIRVELVKTLIRELARLKEDSPHVPLAALTAMSGLGLLDKETKIQAAHTVHENEWGLRSNYVTKVFLAFLVSEKLIESGTTAYKIGKSILSTTLLPLSQRFNDWFLETLSPRGNAHSEAIPLLMDELMQATEIADLRIKDAIDSVDHLADIVEGLDRSLVRKEASEMFLDKMDAMKVHAGTVRGLLTQRISECVTDGWRQNTRQAMDDYIAAMKSLVDAYFHRIPSTKEYWREQTFETKALTQVIRRIDWKKASSSKSCNSKELGMRDRAVRISHAGEINFDSDTGEVWIMWHRFIAGIVLDLLRNAVYSCDAIHDPWDPGRPEKADLWIRVDYEKEYVDLILANASHDKSEHVFSKLKKHRWSHLMDLGGRITYEEIPKEDVVGIRVRIPYAAYLRS